MNPVVVINLFDTNPLEQEGLGFYFPAVGFVGEDESRLVCCFIAEAGTWAAPWTEGTTWTALMAFDQSFLAAFEFFLILILSRCYVRCTLH